MSGEELLKFISIQNRDDHGRAMYWFGCATGAVGAVLILLISLYAAGAWY